MNLTLNWIEVASVIGVVATAGGLAILYRRLSSKRERNGLRPDYSAEIATLRDLVITLQLRVDELTVAEEGRAASLGTFSPPSSINVNKRSEALRMYNRGGDTDSVRAALGLPRADAMLLRKVQRVLSTPLPGTPHRSGNHLNGILRPASQ